MEKTLRNKIIAGLSALIVLLGGGAAFFGTSISERVVTYQLAGTSTSSPLSIGSSATTTAYISAVDSFTQLNLNSVANVSTTETISIKTDLSVEDACGNSPTSVNWFNVSTTALAADGNLSLNLTNNLLAKCLKFEIYNASSTVTSTLFLQATLR
jgi:hypothetical protein